jgi:hypothetical protein
MSSVSNSLASSSLTGSPIQGGGKRKVNKSLKAWVTFVKKVQKEEKLNYKEAIHRAKVRKDKGEKWMNGGAMVKSMSDMGEENMGMSMSDMDEDERKKAENEDIITGGRRRKSMRRRRSTRRRSTRRRR